MNLLRLSAERLEQEIALATRARDRLLRQLSHVNAHLKLLLQERSDRQFEGRTEGWHPERRMSCAARVLCVAALVCLLCGCCSYSYSHDTLDANGKVTGHYAVSIFRNAMDTSAASVDVTLADGTALRVIAPNSQPDPTVVGALASFGQALAALGAAALRMFGL